MATARLGGGRRAGRRPPAGTLGRLVIEGAGYDEYRFWRQPRLRLTMLVRHGGGATITVTGEQPDEVSALHAELLAG